LSGELIPYSIASAFVSSILAHPMLNKKGKEKKTLVRKMQGKVL